MSISIIRNDNIEYLYDFLKNELPVTFRYFSNRTVEAIKNHVITIIYRLDNKSIGYGHIDLEENIQWLGCCVLPTYQSMGIGTKILQYLINMYNTLPCNTLPCNTLQLSVDKNNTRAYSLYIKCEFKVIKEYDTIYIMKYDKGVLYLPVSYGEGFDKLTILDIKKSKLSDDKLQCVITEYDELYNKLSQYIKQYAFYYNLLKKINLDIWVKQDIFRISNNDTEKNKLCNDIILLNDSRFRIKNKINYVLHSYIKEQKAYIPKKAIILTHIGLGDNITAIPAVRYYSIIYDEIYVIAKNHNKHNVELFYSDDPTIKVIGVKNDNEYYTSPIIKELINDSNVVTAGCHTKDCKSFNYLPFNFYDDMKLEYSVFWNYNYIAQCKESVELYNILKTVNNTTKYVFIHNTTSGGTIFDYTSTSDILIINPCINSYTPEHPYYEIAEKFINKPLAYYSDIIINASEVIVSDSSFMCLSIQLPIKTDKCYYISRDNTSYDHIWDSKYGYDVISLYRKFNRIYNYNV